MAEVDNKMADVEKLMAECGELAKQFATERTKDNMVRLMEKIENAVLFVPVQTDESVEELLRENAKEGGQVQLPKGTKMQTRLLKASNGDMVFPVFTSIKDMNFEGMNKQVMMMPFIECARVALNEKNDIKVVVVNPFTDNVGIVDVLLKAAVERREAVDKANAAKAAGNGGMREIQVTEKQFHLLVREKVEFAEIPKRVFLEKEEFMNDIHERREKLFYEIYRDAYEKRIPCPYKESQFSVMILNLREKFQMICVELPIVRMQITMAYKMYITWDQENNEFNYFLIEKDKKGKVLAKVEANGKHHIIGDAPEEGSEMNTIMDYLGIE